MGMTLNIYKYLVYVLAVKVCHIVKLFFVYRGT